MGIPEAWVVKAQTKEIPDAGFWPGQPCYPKRPGGSTLARRNRDEELEVRSALTSPKEYRDFAAQCLRWAARAKSEEHRSVMLNMAHHWMQTAQKLERAPGPAVNPGGSRKPR